MTLTINSETVEAVPYETGMEDGFVWDCTYRAESGLKNVKYKLLNNEGDTLHRNMVEAFEGLQMSILVKTPFIEHEGKCLMIRPGDYIVTKNGQRATCSSWLIKTLTE